MGPDCALTEAEFLRFSNQTFRNPTSFFWTIFKNNPCILGEYGAWYFVATKLITDEGIKAARKISEVKSKEGIHNAVIDVIKVGVSNMHVQATGSEKTTALVHFVSYSKLHTISHTLCIRHGM